MGKDSSIEWTHHTYNLWWGCVKVGQGCKNCYAETWSKRSGENYWGPNMPRRFFKDTHYRLPLTWDWAAARAGERHRVFCGSMMDLFEQHQDDATAVRMAVERHQLFVRIIPATLNLDWLLLTKRLENVLEMVPPSWHQAWPSNVWLGFSASTQEEYEDGMLELAAVVGSLQIQSMPPVLFVSLEPLLGSIDILSFCPNCDGSGSVDSGGVDPQGHGIDVPCPEHTTFLDWVIIGGESGKDARPMHPDWARRVRDDCAAAGVPYFLKQWGAWLPAENYVEGWHNGVLPEGAVWMADGQGSATHVKVNKKLAGAILDGREWQQVPEVQHASS